MLTTNVVDEILKDLTKQNFISIFFITIDLISPSHFLEIIKNDKKFMEKSFRELLEANNYDKNLLIEILGTIKKYRCLRLLDSCRHIWSKMSQHRLSEFWKFLYGICEQMTEEDFKCLETFSGGIQDDICPEVLLVKAYEQKIFNEKNLINLSEALKCDRPDLSKLLDVYNDSNKEYFYHVTTPSESKPCGLAVIINHIEFKSDGPCPPLKTRKDSFLDVEALKNLWIKFGFKVSIHTDLTDVAVVKLFESLAKQDHTCYDVFVACYLSHGSEGVVYGSNCKPILISKLEDIMANQCLTLINKPKLFFIQACQGHKIQQGVFSKTVSLQTAEIAEDTSNSQISFYTSNATPRKCDILTVVSTIPGYASFGPYNKNSWFIEALVTNMENYGHKCSVHEIVQKVIHQVATQKGQIHQVANQEGQFEDVTCKQTPIAYYTMQGELLLKRCM